MNLIIALYMLQIPLAAYLAKRKGSSAYLGIIAAVIIPVLALPLLLIHNPKLVTKTINPEQQRFINSYYDAQTVYAKLDLSAYNSLEEVISIIGSYHPKSVEVTLLKAKTLSDWEYNFTKYINVYKLLRTIYLLVPSSKNYHTNIISKISWGTDSFRIEYDASNYTIIIKTGFYIQLKNRNQIPNALLDEAQKNLIRSIMLMKEKLPSERYKKILQHFTTNI